MTRFFIVDDHPVARTAIRSLLEDAGHTVVGEAESGIDALAKISLTKPDMMVIDIDINGMDGLELIQSLRMKGNLTPAIVMSGKNAEYYAARSARCGASGFLSKKNNLSDLLLAIEAVSKGYGYFPLGSNWGRDASENNSDADKLRSLSAREFQVLEYLARGMEVKAISECMQISDRTISTYKSRLMDKLSLKTRTDIYEFVRRNHIS